MRRTAAMKLCAAWLTVLAALPFTAPFAALDLSDFLGASHSRTTLTTVGVPTASAAQDDDADDVTASDACVQRSHHITTYDLSPVTSPAGGDVLPPRNVVPDRSDLFSHDDPALALALRV